MAVRLAINGFGRIGRLVLRALHESGRTDLEVVAVNDLGPVETNAHLLKYDSAHGPLPGDITVGENSIDLGCGPIQVIAERDPAGLPWNAKKDPCRRFKRWEVLEGRPELLDALIARQRLQEAAIGRDDPLHQLRGSQLRLLALVELRDHGSP